MRSLQARLDARVEHEPNTGCQLWSGFTDANGYGRLKVEGAVRFAHRVSYAVNKEDPGALKVCHRCDTPACINPAHLFLGTQSDNMHDMWAKRRARPGKSVGEHNGRAKLSDADVLRIRALVLAGQHPREVAPHFGVTTDWVRRMTRTSGQQKRVA